MLLDSLILIVICSVLSRMAGGGLGAGYLTIFKWVPEAALSILTAFLVPLNIIGGLLVYFGWQTGHGTVYHMTGFSAKTLARKVRIERIVRPVYDFFRWSIYKPSYSWVVMGLKGLVVGLAMFPAGLLFAFLFPFSYCFKKTEIGEYLSGAFFGLLLVISIIYGLR